VDSITKSLDVNKRPSAGLSFLDSVVCEGECVVLSYSTTLGDDANLAIQFWDGGVMRIPSGNRIEVCNQMADFASMELIVFDENGCRDTATIGGVGMWLPVPIADIGVNQTYFEAPPAEVQLNDLSLYADSISWTRNQEYITSDEAMVEVIKEGGAYNYVLTAQNSIGCFSKDSVVIVIDPGYTLFVPNTLTSNRDEINENFNVKGIGLEKENFELIIFDRWGDVIFKTEELHQGWDGSFQNTDKLVKQDVYVYKIQVRTITQETINLMGKVHVIR